jgi:hypothetical protein
LDLGQAGFTALLSRINRIPALLNSFTPGPVQPQELKPQTPYWRAISALPSHLELSPDLSVGPTKVPCLHSLAKQPQPPGKLQSQETFPQQPESWTYPGGPRCTQLRPWPASPSPFSCSVLGLPPSRRAKDGLGPPALYRAQPHPRLTIDPWALVGEQTPLTERVNLLGLLAPLPSELGRIRQKCRKKSGNVANTQILFLLRPLKPW